MSCNTKPTIQDVIDQAKRYFDAGVSRQEAIRRAIDANKPISPAQKEQRPLLPYTSSSN